MNEIFDIHTPKNIADCKYNKPDAEISGNIIQFDIIYLTELFEKLRDFPDSRYVLIKGNCDIHCKATDIEITKDGRPVVKRDKRDFRRHIPWPKSISPIENQPWAQEDSNDSHLISVFQLLSGNDNTRINYVNIPKNVCRIYASGIIENHEILRHLPFGVAPKDWFPGQYDVAEACADKTHIDRDKFIYCSFKPETWKGRRPIYNFLSRQKDWITFEDGNIPYKDYFNRMKEHKLVICPRGNCVESYRMWESLYLGCIPVVQNNVSNRHWAKYLPIILIDDWLTITPKLLDNAYENIESKREQYKLEMLNKSWWENKIRNELATNAI
tara:strand:- start:41 stop:1021 length:981 start_codon:yes stop_codon:yes gene_type:complete